MIGLPVELTLRRTEDGLRLCAYPVKELEGLRGKPRRFGPAKIEPDQNLLAGLQGDLWDVETDISTGDAEAVGFVLRGVTVNYDVKKAELSCGERHAALKPVEGRIRLRLLLDRASLDIFGDDGRVYMPMGVIPKAEDRSLALLAKGGPATLQSLQVYELRSAWRP
jgi:sucrose-6-phosphate hydrolase SacC (GH32 family)